jgi:hypothetical protein
MIRGMSPPTSFTLSEKREALEQILASATFSRSEQHRHFLQFVCEMEMAGRGAELNEYLIGVEVLHRSGEYSPGTDSSVRSRAYELRQRLERYYEKESPDSRIRIDVPKGSYVPVFLDSAARRILSPQEAPIPLPDERVPPPPLTLVHRWPLAVAFIAGCLLMLAAVAFWVKLRPNGGVDPVLQEVWAPLARPGADVLMLIGSTLHMTVRPNWLETSDSPPRYKVTPELYPYFRKQRRLKPDVELFMHPTENSLDYGELKAVVAAANVLRAAGANYQVLPERATSFAAVRDRCIIELGNAQTSNIAQEELSRALWTIDFEPPMARVAIVDQKQAGRPTPFLATNGKPSESSWACGLITVLPIEGPLKNARTVVISGVTPTGTEAAMEFFTSPAALRDLRQRFQHDGLSGFPSSYQVVVKCRSRDTFLLTAEYAAHHVLVR